MYYRFRDVYTVRCFKISLMYTGYDKYIVYNMLLCYLVLIVQHVAVFAYAVMAGACGLQTFRGVESARLWWLLRMGYEYFMEVGLLCRRGGGGYVLLEGVESV
jgi:hypothetical protein